MRSVESWLSEYGESHRHPVNQAIHRVCVPAIFFSIVAMLRLIELPAEWGAPTWLGNGAIIGLLGPMVFYLLLDRRIFLAMSIFVGLILLLVEWLAAKHLLFIVGFPVFTTAWAGQFVGHRIEGKKPAFLKDLVFLLIGPIWTLVSWSKSAGTENRSAT